MLDPFVVGGMPGHHGAKPEWDVAVGVVVVVVVVRRGVHAAGLLGSSGGGHRVGDHAGGDVSKLGVAVAGEPSEEVERRLLVELETLDEDADPLTDPLTG